MSENEKISGLPQEANNVLTRLTVTNVLVGVASLGYNTVSSAAGATLTLRPETSKN